MGQNETTCGVVRGRGCHDVCLRGSGVRRRAGAQNLAGRPICACVGVGTDTIGGLNNPNAEVEPWIADNPEDPQKFIASWQQDRWNDGGSKGLVAGWSFDNGKTWGQTPLPFSQCAAPFYKHVAPFDRASDPWDSIGPDGKAYAVGLPFNANDTHNGIAAVTSTDDGRTWGHLRLIIDDLASDPIQPADDKESVTADPNTPGVAYVVWDRIVNTTCGAAVRRIAPQLDDHPAFRGPSAALNCFSGPSFFARTTDGGVTWETARPIVPTGVNEQTIGNQIVVNRKSGALFNFFDFITADGVFHAQMVYSLDKGVTWSARQTIGDIESGALIPGRGGVVDPRTQEQVRSGDIIPEPAIDPETGRLYLVWQDARFNGGTNDQVVISTSGDRLGRTGTWSAPKLVSPAGDPAAFNPDVVVNREGQVAVVFVDFRRLDYARVSILPTDAWVRVANGGPGLDFDRETHVGGGFNLKAAPIEAGQGFFPGDYNGITVNERTGGFEAIWVGTDCADTKCTAIENPTGAPTGRPDPTDVFVRRVAGGEDQGDEGD
jgi:hypothetical protein